MKMATYGVEVSAEPGDQPHVRIDSGIGGEVVVSLREVDALIEMLKEAKAELAAGE